LTAATQTRSRASNRRAALLILGVVLLAVAFCAATLVHRAYPDDFYARNLHSLFDLNGEANVPAWFSTVLWLLAARAAWKVGDVELAPGAPLSGRDYWRLLAGVAVFLSLDESAAWHEKVGLAITLWRDGSPGEFLDGAPMFAWTIYGLAFAAVAAAVFAPFLLRLDHRTGALLVLAGALFVGGSTLLENAAPVFWDLGLYFPARVEELFEETSEMLAVILLIFTLERRGRICAETPVASPRECLASEAA
jgi:hypothetical protein